ncbi:MAG: ABC transporter substrate-binding protein [Lachnospiraceae bacterium]|nr:ABC transporter substrate-binding protein [Lachnospiraceae bacterium]
MKKKVVAVILAAALAMSMTACGEKGQTSEGSTSAAASESKETEETKESESGAAFGAREERIADNEVIVAIGSEPESGFDSTTGGHGSITKLVFSTMFARDKELGWTGDLATDYEVSEDRLTWTVTLRDDAYFTDGEKVTADDVAYTYRTAKESGSDIDLTIIDSIEVLNETQVAFHLTRIYSPFIERLAYLGIVPEHAHDENFKDQPVGSGPYKLVQWDKGQQMIFQANQEYYGEAPKMQQITIALLETDTAVAALENGTIDVAEINGNLASKEIAGASVIDIESIECYGVCFPMVPAEGKKAEDGAEIGNDVTSDLAIRQAFNRAVDRELMVEGIMNGYGSVSTTGLEQMPWLNEDTVLDASEYNDIEGAKQILADAGWEDTDGDGIVEKDGLKAEFPLLYTTGKYRQEMALEFVRVGQEIGVQVDLEQVTWDTILPKIHTSAVMYGFGSGDPSELYNLYYGGMAGGPVAWDNSGVYANDDCDAAIDKALEAEDEADAIQYWQEAQKYASAIGDSPYCWFANANHVYYAADGFSFGQPVVQPHGGRIFDNVVEWTWE